jgi:ketosteroid isomerase-like protein
MTRPGEGQVHMVGQRAHGPREKSGVETTRAHPLLPRDTTRGMSQLNLEDFVRRAYARFNGAEREPPDEEELASLDFWHPDGVYVNDVNDPDPGIHEGIDEVRRQVGRWIEAYPDLQVDPVEIQTNGDLAFVWVRFSGHGAGSGVPIDMELAHVLTVKGGKTRRLAEYSERADGLEAAGLLK